MGTTSAVVEETQALLDAEVWIETADGVRYGNVLDDDDDAGGRRRQIVASLDAAGDLGLRCTVCDIGLRTRPAVRDVAAKRPRSEVREAVTMAKRHVGTWRSLLGYRSVKHHWRKLGLVVGEALEAPEVAPPVKRQKTEMPSLACAKCDDAGPGLVVCARCPRAYHARCLPRGILDATKALPWLDARGRWLCAACESLKPDDVLDAASQLVIRDLQKSTTTHPGGDDDVARARAVYRALCRHDFGRRLLLDPALLDDTSLDSLAAVVAEVRRALARAQGPAHRRMADQLARLADACFAASLGDDRAALHVVAAPERRVAGDHDRRP